MAETEEDDNRTIFAILKDTILTPIVVLTSKPAQRAYVQGALLFSAAIALALISAVAYILFYYNFVPRTAFERTIHLQFGNGHPFGSATLTPDVVSVQPYDVKVILHMPRTPSNLAQGNFMIDLALAGPTTSNASSRTVPGQVLAQSRRPAIMTYYSHGVETVIKAVDLPWYLTGFKHESETLTVPMMEGVQFVKGWRNVPASLRLELQSEERLHVYSAKVAFTTRFRGLRWIMYNHRILSFLGFTTAFWIVEMGSAILLWLAISHYTGTPAFPLASATVARPIKDEVKTEDEDVSEGLSDTSRTFPTYAGQPALRYSSPSIKKEEEEEEEEKEPSFNLHPNAAEADDEDEDADFVLDTAGVGLGAGGRSDSGLGTSMESNVERMDPVRRRKAGGSGNFGERGPLR